MEWLFWTIFGVVVAAAADWDAIPAGLVIGFIIGMIRQGQSKRRAAEDAKRDQRLLQLEREVAGLGRALRALQHPPAPQAAVEAAPAAAHEGAPADTAIPPPAAEPDAEAQAAPLEAELPDLATLTAARSAPAERPLPEAWTRPAEAAATAPREADLLTRARHWLLGGNTLVRLGILVLFFGFAFLAKFAAEHALLPVELRLAAVAGGGIALLFTGWRLREQRSTYAMTLQGGGIAVLYLTVFAALRIFSLLPAEFAFALLLAIVAFAAALALLQDARALAVIGTAGGFAAPILTATGGGSHVTLFAYYALLNAGVLLIARYKAWRILNLEGFLFTFVIGLAWGAQYYRPEFLHSTEPFLILYWLMFTAAAVFYARIQAPSLKHYVDGSLVFGVPVCGFGLQAALVRDIPFALAYSALAVGAFYVLLARSLWRREHLGLLAEAFLALGVAFLTLAIPLALDGRWTAAAWALEGAALVWIGTRQQRRLATAAGLLLQLAAGVAFSLANGARHYEDNLPVLNGALLGCGLIALGAFLSGYFCNRQRKHWPWLGWAEWLMLAWGCLWWLGGGLNELDWLTTQRQFPSAALAFVSASALLAWWLRQRSDWSALGLPALLPLPAMLLALLPAMSFGASPLQAYGLLAWPLALAAHLWVLHRMDEDDAGAALRYFWHGAAVWLLVLMLGTEAAERVRELTSTAAAWRFAAGAFPALLLVLATPRMARSTRWPFDDWHSAYTLLGAAPVAAGLLAWSVLINTASNGSAAPLPYLPLLNPLDLMILAVLVAVLRWLQQGQGDEETPPILRQPGWPLLGLAAFLAANGALLRALHHALAIPYRLPSLLASDAVQAALALFWSMLALLVMLTASRRGLRLLWMVGATLLGLTVLKLFLVDMANSGTVARIVAFIGAGLLLLVVGYFSPLPPREDKES